jgi:hypothetical protein
MTIQLCKALVAEILGWSYENAIRFSHNFFGISGTPKLECAYPKNDLIFDVQGISSENLIKNESRWD